MVRSFSVSWRRVLRMNSHLSLCLYLSEGRDLLATQYSAEPALVTAREDWPINPSRSSNTSMHDTMSHRVHSVYVAVWRPNQQQTVGPRCASIDRYWTDPCSYYCRRTHWTAVENERAQTNPHRGSES
uniref:Putative secreted peptide n=1 Tax=Anopheles braziliensis TaxID=58242 RepID=A0A2M3ZTH3_9DIPT